MEIGNENQSRMEAPEKQVWKLHSLMLYKGPAPIRTDLALLLTVANVATFSCFPLTLKYSKTLEVFKSEIRTREQFKKKKEKKKIQKTRPNCHSDLPYTVQKQTAK